MKIHSRVKVYTFALTLYSIGLIVIFIMTSDYHRHRKMVSKERFNFAVEKVISRIQNRFKQYEYGLKGLRGIYLTSPTLTWSQFITYSESRDYKSEFPGALGIGHVTRVYPKDLNLFFEKTQKDRPVRFNYRSLEAKKDVHYIIDTVYPVEPNMKAYGLDLASEERRFEAAELAMDSQSPTITAPIVLVQDSGKTPGILFFYQSIKSDQILRLKKTELKIYWDGHTPQLF